MSTPARKKQKLSKRLQIGSRVEVLFDEPAKWYSGTVLVDAVKGACFRDSFVHTSVPNTLIQFNTTIVEGELVIRYDDGTDELVKYPSPDVREFEQKEKRAKRKSCEHGRQRSQCKECGGGSICEHGRQRSRCKECGGSGICEHGRVRRQCKECGGSGICEHGIQEAKCKVCQGSGITVDGELIQLYSTPRVRR